MHYPPQRIAALHDLSCFGRCALTVVIPTLSVMGYQVVPVPTALLSTHTGGFQGFHFRDLSEDMEKIADHFSELRVPFRSIYTGFLGSEEQIETVIRFIERFRDTHEELGRCPLILVDPVMGDDGKLYSTYTPAMVEGVKRLSHYANLLTPNLTEACLLTDTPYFDTKQMDPDEAMARVDELLQKLRAYESERVVITGVFLSDGTLANVGRDHDGWEFSIHRPLEKFSFPGTGDIFASVLLGYLLRGCHFHTSCEQAADFTATLIRSSSNIPTPHCEGVALEEHLWRICRNPYDYR